MRDLPVGNGRLLVNFDSKYQIRDVYFPHVGQENHTEGFAFRFGVWVDDAFSWIDDDEWQRDLRYLPETLVTDVTLSNARLGIELNINDTIASHSDIFLRRVAVKSLTEKNRQVRVFLHQDFRIYENNVGDTAYFDPEIRALIHYKKHRYFLINTLPHFTDFSTGRKAFRDQEGTWRDAEDGRLEGGVITEGSVDSTVAIHLDIEKDSTAVFHYWIAAGTSRDEVAALNADALRRGPQRYLDYTSNYWKAWVNKNDTDLSGISDRIAEFYKRSLLIVKTQIDRDGAILAANDSDVAERATDHYSYLWTRDGALVANALDLAGFEHLSRRFFDLCTQIVHPHGYFLQKYNPDGTVASGWHASWDKYTMQPLAPIQEDETALVLWALWQHYDIHRDIDLAHRAYKQMVQPCANFMAGFRHTELGLPSPSWNLWEDRRGIHTFTCSAVVGGLRAAAKFSRLFAETENAVRYELAADEIVEAMQRHLYRPDLGRFLRSLQFHGDHHFEPDPTIDASMFGIFYFDCFPPNDEMVVGTMNAIAEHLAAAGGIARFQNDGYMRSSGDVTGNAWFICTLWLADHYIASAKDLAELDRALPILEWTINNALPSGVLAEQLDAVTGLPASVSPLTWSHSTFVATTAKYLKRKREMLAAGK